MRFLYGRVTFIFITMTKFLFLIFELIQQNIQIFLYSRITFIADERFQAYFKDTTKEWILQIKYVQARDAGIYECQVSTEPKVSARAQLHVVGKEWLKFFSLANRNIANLTLYLILFWAYC